MWFSSLCPFGSCQVNSAPFFSRGEDGIQTVLHVHDRPAKGTTLSRACATFISLYILCLQTRKDNFSAYFNPTSLMAPLHLLLTLASFFSKHCNMRPSPAFTPAQLATISASHSFATYVRAATARSSLAAAS